MQKLKEKKEEYEEERRRRELEKKKEKKKEPSFQAKPLEKEIEIKIPIIKLEKPKVEIKKITLSKEIPSIEKEEVEIKIPVIRLSSPVFGEKKIELNKTIPPIEPKKEKIKIPLVRLRKVTVKSVTSKFDSNIYPIKPKSMLKIRVPIYRTLKPPKVKRITSFDEKIDEELLKMLEERRVEVTESQVSPPSGWSESSAGGEEIEEKPPDIIEFIFKISPTKLLSKGPIVVLFKELERDSTIGSFETLCMRIFREKKGGEPHFFSIKKPDEFNLREIEKYIKPEGNIIRIDLDELKEAKNIEEIISVERLKETLDRFVAGDVSFLIFKTRDKELYNECRKVLKDLCKYMEHPLEIAEVAPQKMTIEQKKILTELAWGVSVELPWKIMKDGLDRPTLDDIFNKIGRKRHEKYLEKLREEKGGIYALVTNQHEGEESDLHLQMKWFIVKLLANRYKLRTVKEIEEVIKTEERLKEGPKPDVFDENEGVAYEVETLFSEDREGKTPIKKIDESIKKYNKKYKDDIPVKKIIIVLDNLTLLIHLREIYGIKKHIKEWERESGKKVEFVTLDIENHRLIPLSEFSRKLKNLTINLV